jgi:Skp family chaperone for outer membrane proteins
VQEQDQSNDLKAIVHETGMQAYIMIMDAHMHNMIEPGSYTKRLNETLTNNGYDSVILGDIPRSDKLFSCGDLGNTLVTLRKISKKAKETKKEKKRDLADEDTSSEDSDGTLSGMEDVQEDTIDTQDSEIISRHLEKEGLLEQSADELEVQIVVQDGINKHKDLTPRGIKQLYEKGQLKFIIRSNSTYTTELVQHLIDQEKLKESRENIKYMSTTQFKKIRNGPERSPMKEDSKKHRAEVPPSLPSLE